MMDEGLQILNLRIRGPIWGMTYTDLWMTVPRIAGFESILSTTWYFSGGFGAPKMQHGGTPNIQS